MRALLPAVLFAAPAAALSPAPPSLAPAEFARLSLGSFTSAAQAAADGRYDVVEGEYHLLRSERDGAVQWLYQEQAIIRGDRAAAKAKPYFQRVARITLQPDGTLTSESFALKEPARFVGFGQPGYAGPTPTEADLGPPSCPARIERVAAGHFIARIDDCPNAWRGAVRMTSARVVTPDGFANWDRGFDAAGRQVWGPADGGYIFRRR